MKLKLFLLVLSSVFILQSLRAQIPIYKQPYKSLKDFQGDVLKYLTYNFIDTKENFTGKDLMNLLDKIEPKFIEYLPMIKHTPAGIKGISLFFKNDSTLDKTKAAQYPVLRITFRNLLIPLDSAFKLWKNDKKQWTENERNFYGKGIINDFIIGGSPSKEGPPPTEYKPGSD